MSRVSRTFRPSVSPLEDRLAPSGVTAAPPTNPDGNPGGVIVPKPFPVIVPPGIILPVVPPADKLGPITT